MMQPPVTKNEKDAAEARWHELLGRAPAPGEVIYEPHWGTGMFLEALERLAARVRALEERL